MKKMVTVMLCMLMGLLAYTCSTTTALAADWVLYNKGGNIEFYYDPAMSYLRDSIGETPFIKVRIKIVQAGQVVENRDYKVEPDLCCKSPIQKSKNIAMMGFEFEEPFAPSEWRLIEAITEWKRRNPRK